MRPKDLEMKPVDEANAGLRPNFAVPSSTVSLASRYSTGPVTKMEGEIDVTRVPKFVLLPDCLRFVRGEKKRRIFVTLLGGFSWFSES